MIVSVKAHPHLATYLCPLDEDGRMIPYVASLNTETLVYVALDPSSIGDLSNDHPRGPCTELVWREGTTFETARAYVEKHPELAELRFRCADGSVVDGARDKLRALALARRFVCCVEPDCTARQISRARCGLHMRLDTKIDADALPMPMPMPKRWRVVAIIDVANRQALMIAPRGNGTLIVETNTCKTLTTRRSSHPDLLFAEGPFGDATGIRTFQPNAVLPHYWPIDPDAPDDAVTESQAAAEELAAIIPIQPGIFG